MLCFSLPSLSPFSYCTSPTLHPSLSLHTPSLSLPPHSVPVSPSTHHLSTSFHTPYLPPTSPARPSATFGGKQVLPMGELPIKPSDLKKRPPPQPGGLATQGTTCKCCIVSQHCTFPNTCTCHHTIVLSLSLHLCTHLQPKFLLLTSLIRCVPSDTACPTLAPPSLGHLSSTHPSHQPHPSIILAPPTHHPSPSPYSCSPSLLPQLLPSPKRKVST